MEAVPQSFLYGAATSAHQVEGNNTHSDCWVIEHLKHSPYTEPSGMAVDHYNRFAEDIRLMAEAGLTAYRFSIEWARIEPAEGHFDDAEIEHYRKMLECCYENRLTPIVTLHHFSSPAWLIGKGGWGKEYVVSAFARYCEYVTQKLGSLMPIICTINEANMGYQSMKIGMDMMKMKKREKKEGDIQVGLNFNIQNLLLGMFEKRHAFHCSPFAVDVFLMARSQKKEAIVMRAHQAAKLAIKAVAPNSKVGLTLSLYDYQPVDGGEEQAAKLWHDDFGFYLPYIKDDDFLGVQNYTRKIVGPEGSRQPTPDAPLTQMAYEYYPASIGNLLRTVSKEFRHDLYVTENGIATTNDTDRCAFVREAINGILAAKADGIPVKGYFYWSLLDNFEWQAGFSKTFGLVAVDHASQTRYPKDSLFEYGRIARAHKE